MGDFLRFVRRVEFQVSYCGTLVTHFWAFSSLHEVDSSDLMMLGSHDAVSFRIGSLATVKTEKEASLQDV